MALERRPLKKENMIMMQKKREKDKQYEAKRVRSNIQSWLAGRSWLRYDKNSKKMFCDYCIKNGVTTKYYVKKQLQRVLMHLLLLLSKHEIGKYQGN